MTLPAAGHLDLNPMPNWITLIPDDLDDTKVAAVMAALRTAALREGQADPVTEVITRVTARIRAEIAGCARNRVDSDTTKIPADLKALACRMVVFEMMGRLPGQDLSEDERATRKEDLRYLERIARCDVPVATPDDAATPEVQQGGGFEQVGNPVRLATRTKMQGL